MGWVDAEGQRILSQAAAARLVRGRDGLLSSGSLEINDLEVRGENSRGKGQQPGAQHQTCCLLMANSFYCTLKALCSAGSQRWRKGCACKEQEALPNSRAQLPPPPPPLALQLFFLSLQPQLSKHGLLLQGSSQRGRHKGTCFHDEHGRPQPDQL